MSQKIELKKGSRLPSWVFQVRRKDPVTDKWEDDDLSDVTAVKIYMKNVSTDVVKIAGTAGSVYDLANALIEYSPAAVDVDTVGTYTLEYELTRTGGKTQTLPSGEYEDVYVIISEDNKA